MRHEWEEDNQTDDRQTNNDLLEIAYYLLEKVGFELKPLP